MRADNDGEGGIMALIALIQRANLRSRGARIALVGLGVFGASLFYGDGMITPAISVLSAVEGLEVVSPDLKELVVPLTLVVLSALFFVQRFGTGRVGRFFGPIMCVWFGVLAISGFARLLEHPSILGALSPHYGAQFLFEHGHEAFVALGGVVLAVTGAEALYADMGHFGAGAIRRGWFVLVFPALILNYLGQGALILENPAATASPFFLLFPDWALIPMVILSTVAAIIASQAVISGAFSVTRQAIRLGFLPRLVVRHTSRKEIGQVYVPGRELDHLRRGRRARARLRLLGAAGQRLRHRGHRHAGDRHAAVLLRRPRAVAPAAVARHHRRGRVPDRRPDVLRRQPDEDLPRRLVPARDRAVRVQRAHHLAARARDRHPAPGRGGGPAA